MKRQLPVLIVLFALPPVAPAQSPRQQPAATAPATAPADPPRLLVRADAEASSRQGWQRELTHRLVDRLRRKLTSAGRRVVDDRRLEQLADRDEAIRRVVQGQSPATLDRRLCDLLGADLLIHAAAWCDSERPAQGRIRVRDRFRVRVVAVDAPDALADREVESEGRKIGSAMDSHVAAMEHAMPELLKEVDSALAKLAQLEADRGRLYRVTFRTEDTQSEVVLRGRDLAALPEVEAREVELADSSAGRQTFRLRSRAPRHVIEHRLRGLLETMLAQLADRGGARLRASVWASRNSFDLIASPWPSRPRDLDDEVGDGLEQLVRDLYRARPTQLAGHSVRVLTTRLPEAAQRWMVLRQLGGVCLNAEPDAPLHFDGREFDNAAAARAELARRTEAFASTPAGRWAARLEAGLRRALAETAAEPIVEPSAADQLLDRLALDQRPAGAAPELRGPAADVLVLLSVEAREAGFDLHLAAVSSKDGSRWSAARALPAELDQAVQSRLRD